MSMDFRPFLGICSVQSAAAWNTNTATPLTGAPSSVFRGGPAVTRSSGQGFVLVRLEPALLTTLLYAENEQAKDSQETDGTQDAKQAQHCKNTDGKNCDCRKVDDHLTELPPHPGHLLSERPVFCRILHSQYTKNGSIPQEQIR